MISDVFEEVFGSACSSLLVSEVFFQARNNCLFCLSTTIAAFTAGRPFLYQPMNSGLTWTYNQLLTWDSPVRFPSANKHSHCWYLQTPTRTYLLNHSVNSIYCSSVVTLQGNFKYRVNACHACKNLHITYRIVVGGALKMIAPVSWTWSSVGIQVQKTITPLWLGMIPKLISTNCFHRFLYHAHPVIPTQRLTCYRFRAVFNTVEWCFSC